MKKLVYVLISLIVILLSVVIFLFNNNLSSNNSPPQPAECDIITNNGEGKIDIVFLSSENNARRFSDYLFSVDPYKSMKENFNIFYVDSPLDCEIYKDIALFCYSKANVKLASSCPNDYIIAVKDGYDNDIRSSTYMNFVTLNSAHQLSVISHEFSHALASLADEYVPATIPKGSTNCAADCKDFSESNGCFQGCSKDSYFRSVDYGIMRSLSATSFGDFDSSAIISKINYQLLSPAMRKKNSLTGNVVSDIVDCSSQSYYLVSGHYDGEKVVIDGKSREEGCVGNNGFGSFDYEVITDSGDLYSDGSFNPEYIIAESQSESQEQIVGDQLAPSESFYLKIPAIDNLKSFNILSEGERVAQVTLNDDNFRFCKI